MQIRKSYRKARKRDLNCIALEVYPIRLCVTYAKSRVPSHLIDYDTICLECLVKLSALCTISRLKWVWLSIGIGLLQWPRKLSVSVSFTSLISTYDKCSIFSDEHTWILSELRLLGINVYSSFIKKNFLKSL